MADTQIIADIQVNSDDVKLADKRIDELTDSIEELGNRIKQAREQNNQYKKSQDELIKQYKSRKITEEQLIKGIDEINKKIKTNNKVIADSSIALQSQKRERDANIRLINSEVGAYTNLSNQYTVAAKKAKDLAAAYGINSKEAKEAANAANQLNNKLKQIDSSVGSNVRRVGDYKGALTGFGKQLLGAAGIVGGVDLLVQGFREFNETAKEINDLTRKIGTNFGYTGDQAKALASNINAISETFGQDYNEVLIAANTVSKELGISGSEAAKLIEEGFLKGSNNSGEFLDILKEYPAQFKSVGIDAETAFAIINQQVREGIYSDKGVDAIKEGGLRLRENTKAVQDALKPLDESIKKQIEQEIAAGNSFKAIQLVSEALNDTSLTAAETQAIIADVFGGAGEDAGLRYLQTLKDIDTNLDNVAIQASSAEQANLNLSKSWNSFVASISDSEGVFGQVFAFLKNALAGAINSVSLLLKIIRGGDKAADQISNITERIKQQTIASIQLRVASNDLAGATELANKAVEKGAITREEANRLLEKQIVNTRELTDAQKKQADENLKQLEEKRKAEEEALEAERERREELNDIEVEALDLRNEIKIEKEEELLEYMAELNDEARKKEEEAVKKSEEKKKIIKQAALTFIDAYSNLYSNLRKQREDEQSNNIQENANRQIDILKNKLDKGLITEDEYNQKVGAIQKEAAKKQAQLTKKNNIFQIGIDTLTAVIKTFANLGWPAGIAPAAGVAASGAINAALVAATPISFGQGTNDIVSIGDSHASGNDVDVWGFSGSKRQYFGKVERGEAMPVIRKSAVNDYMVAKLNGRFSPKNGRKFQDGTPDITSAPSDQLNNQQFINNMVAAFSNIKIVTKIEDITKQAAKKNEIVSNSKV